MLIFFRWSYRNGCVDLYKNSVFLCTQKTKFKERARFVSCGRWTSKIFKALWKMRYIITFSHPFSYCLLCLTFSCYELSLKSFLTNITTCNTFFLKKFDINLLETCVTEAFFTDKVSKQKHRSGTNSARMVNIFCLMFFVYNS